MPFACTYIEKRAEQDYYDRGADPNTSRTVLCESCNIEAESIPALIAAIGKRWFLDIYDVCLPSEDGEVERIGYNRLECDDSSEPSPSELEAWKHGKHELWLCDYDFAIEYREKRSITLDEFKASGVKYHE